MDLIIGLPRTLKQHDFVVVVVYMLSKVAHFILVKTINLASEIAQIFIKEIVRLHGIAKKNISDKDANFTYRFWKELFAGLGTNLALSKTYHP